MIIMKDDLIRRQDARNAICDYVCGRDIRCVKNHECRMKKMISDLPPAHAWNEFSPDDERLKDHYFYLISHKNYDTPIKAKWHEEGYWTEPFTKETLYWRHDEDAWDNVSAWMYLPEKYKEEREE